MSLAEKKGSAVNIANICHYGEERCGHYVFGVIVHAGIPKIKPFKIAGCRGLDHLGEMKRGTQGSYLSEIVCYETALIGHSEILDL